MLVRHTVQLALPSNEYVPGEHARAGAVTVESQAKPTSKVTHNTEG
jgi:hypothetical protein